MPTRRHHWEQNWKGYRIPNFGDLCSPYQTPSSNFMTIHLQLLSI